MAISQFNIISGGDYNTYVTGAADGTYDASVPNAGIIWGDGQGRFGYGQNIAPIAPVNQGSTPDTVTPDEWNALDGILYSIRNHQGASYSLLPTGTIQSGNLIVASVLQGFAPQIVSAYNDVGKCEVNVDGTINISQNSAQWGIDDGVNSKKTLKLIHRIKFGNPDVARYFFNAGGKLKLNFTHIPELASPIDLFWRDMCEAAGVIEIGYQNTVKFNQPGLHPDPTYDYYGDKDTVLNEDNGGYWAHATLPEGQLLQHYRQNNIEKYGYGYGYEYNYYGYDGYRADDYMTVEMSVSGKDGKTGNIGDTITVVTSFINPTASLTVNDIIRGTTSSRLIMSEPAVGYLSIPSWDDYTVESDIAWA